MLSINGLPNYYYDFLQNFESPNTRDAYRVDLKNFTEFKGSTTVNDWSLKDLMDYRDFLSKSSSPSTVRRKLASIMSFTKWCLKYSMIDTDPAYGLKLPKPQTKKPTLAFTDEEVVRILNMPNKSIDREKTHYMILKVLFQLGLRRTELTTILKEHIREDRGHVVLTIFGKGGKTRELPLSKELAKEIKEYAATTPYELLFTVNGKQLNSSTVFRVVQRYAMMAGIKKRVGAHSCRATAISHLLDTQKVPIRDVADFAGHSSINTTAGYDKKRKGLQDSAAYKVQYGSN